jgi:hypothetical protein
MVKTQVYLRKEELDALRMAAALSGRSVAEFIRDAIRKIVPKPQAAGPVAIWEGEPKRTSIEHDKFTTSVDAARGSGFRRQRGLDRPRAVSGSTTFASARAVGAVARGRRETSQFRFHGHRDIHISRSYANRDVALTWKESIYKPGTVRIL